MATGDDLELGATNNSADHFTFLAVKASYAPALHVTNTGDGTHSSPLTAFRGEVGGKASIAIHGISASGGVGVQGEAYSDGVGVRGKSTTGIGVQGTSEDDVGVKGRSSSDVGVKGDSLTHIGVTGGSEYWWGIEGTGQGGVWGAGGVGVLGIDTGLFRTGGVGVWGISGTGVGIYGSSSSNLAAQFDGNVFINGDLTKTGAGSCVAVPGRGGSLRRLYSIDSPESWFEDFGEAQLVNGKAKVKIGRDFAAVVRGRYHIYISAYGSSKGLYVKRRKHNSFSVREQGGGKSSLTFSYRIVAKRKDIAGRRLQKVKLPAPPVLPQRSRKA